MTGMYGHAGFREKIKEEFLRFECDLILLSVNDIPCVSSWLEVGECEGGGAL
ncbi:MAG: hypothetical protein QXS79_06645 [Candidatus Bathyarchaeia archaeon]